jgi:putative ABC transport system permease protein
MNSIIRLLKAAIRAILKNRARSLLTSLGVIIGVGAVIVMVAIGEGSQAQIEKNINNLGTNLVMAIPGSVKSGGAQMGSGSSNLFSFNDIKMLKRDATLLSGISAVVQSRDQVIAGANNWSTSVYGVDPDYFNIRNWKLKSGAAFTEQDVTAKNKVAILGATVTENLYPDLDPIGQTIRIRNIPFTVIGTLESKGQTGMGQDQDDIILAPSTSVLYRLKGSTEIDMIQASAISTEQVDAAIAEMNSILRISRGLHDGQDDDFELRSQAEIMETVTETSETMTLFLGSIAAVSLLVGGIGIMNIMLVSVTERTREIGIRLSVGARESDIVIQFLAESVVLSVSGGIVGIALSVGVVAIINHWSSMQALITPQIVALSFVFSTAIGIFFGYYPARKAASLDPIEALRYE